MWAWVATKRGGKKSAKGATQHEITKKTPKPPRERKLKGEPAARGSRGPWPKKAHGKKKPGDFVLAKVPPRPKGYFTFQLGTELIARPLSRRGGKKGRPVCRQK